MCTASEPGEIQASFSINKFLAGQEIYLSLTKIKIWESFVFSEELWNMPKKGFEMKVETQVFKTRLDDLELSDSNLALSSGEHSRKMAR